MTGHQLSCLLLLGAFFLAPDIVVADDLSGGQGSARAESQADAYADCGGAPIQNGHDVQPTPEHDKCLAKEQHIPPLKNIEKTDEVRPAAEDPADVSSAKAERKSEPKP
jgi:hypothetical protein